MAWSCAGSSGLRRDDEACGEQDEGGQKHGRKLFEVTDADPPPHPTQTLDDTVHQRHRLGILTITAEAERVEFTYLRDMLNLTGGNLSRHLAVLAEAGLIDVTKGYEGRRPRTWIAITPAGRSALTAEIRALEALVLRHHRKPDA